MRKRNQVSPEIPPPDPANSWQEAREQEPQTSLALELLVEEEVHVVEEDGDLPSNEVASDEPAHIVRENTRRFKRYSSSWTSSLLTARTGISVPSTETVAEESDSLTCSEADDPCGALLQYFLKLSNSDDDIDFAYMENLLSNGADISSSDEASGLTIMHTVAEQWDTTVAQFLYERGIDIHCGDKSGKTPLHIAASTDHREMVVWLIKQGADIEAETTIEKQTPVHHAARNDSVQALEALIQHGGNYEVEDYKGRTPLHLAAELDRTVVAEHLLSLEKPAKCTVVDKAGSHVITSMIRTMPQVAAKSLDQLHKLAPADRKQYYMLSNVEHTLGDDHSAEGIKSPFEMAVEEGRYEILSHTVMKELIDQKWKQCVRWYYYMFLALYFLFLFSWSVLIAYPSVQLKHIYTFPDDIWRIGLELIALGTYIHQIVDEIAEVVRSNLKHRRYIAFRRRVIQDDLDNTDLSLPEERKYLMSELEETKKSHSNYFRDTWNIIDVITYFLLFIVIVLHVLDICLHSTELALWIARLSCAAVLFIWIRLLKLIRAFRFMGPLVAILGKLIADIVKYFLLYVIFFMPFLIAVWVMFGGDQAVLVAGNKDLTLFYRVAVVMFRMSLIDSFPYETMREIDEFMTAVLVIWFLIITAVVGLNLFIALLSDTFQRVYDNAQANALLEQARIILQLEDKVSSCTYQRYLKHIQKKCNPYICFYDDDDNSEERPPELQKITHQIHDIVTELQSDKKDLDEHRQAGVSALRDKLEEQDSKLMQLSHQVGEIKSILLSLQQEPVRAQPSLNNSDQPEPSSEERPTHPLAQALYTHHSEPGGSSTEQTTHSTPRLIQVLPKKLVPIEKHHRHQLNNANSIPNMFGRGTETIQASMGSTSAPWMDRTLTTSETSLVSPLASPSHRRRVRK